MALVTLPRQYLADANGRPRVGAKAYFYQAGTTTEITVYQDPDFSTAHPNPVETTSAGIFPVIHVNPGVNPTYKIVITDADDVAIYTEDNIPALGHPAEPFYPRTTAEIAAGVTPVDYSKPADDPYYDVRRSGVRIDSGADDTAALQAALNAAPSNGGCVFVPRGEAVIGGSLIWPTNGDALIPIRIIGAGGHTVAFGHPQSRLRYTGSGTMFDLRRGTGANTTGQIALENIALIGPTDTGVAIDAYNLQGSALKNVAIGNFNNAVQIGGYCYYCNFDDVSIANSKSRGWLIQEELNGTKFHRCRINAIDSAGVVAGNGIGWDVRNSGVLNTWDGCWVENTNIGVRLQNCSHANFRNTYFESCYRAIFVDGPADEQLIEVDGCFVFFGHNDAVFIYDNDRAAWIAIHSLATQIDTDITGNKIVSKVTATPRLWAGRIYPVSGGAVALGDGIPWIYNPSYAAATGFTAFARGDTTPSVLGPSGRYYQTENLSATTITTFDDGVVGQEIIIKIGDDNTTIDFTGTNLKGHGGQDWHPRNGDFMRCVFDGESWLCQTYAGSNTSLATYTVTNGTTSRSFDADAVTTAELADVVATLLADLKQRGIVD